MRVAVFSTKPYDRQSLTEANAAHGHHLDFFETRLTAATAALAAGYDAVCVFVNDQLMPTRSRPWRLEERGCLRCGQRASTMWISMPPRVWGSRLRAFRRTHRTP